MSEDINQEILVQLRKLKRVFCVMLVFIIVGAVPAFYQGVSRGFSQAAPSWERVRTAMGRQEFPAALSMAQALVARQPDYYYGLGYLGYIYLAMGDVKNAEAHYSRAYGLFPNEESEKDLAAVQKRLAAGGDFKLLSQMRPTPPNHAQQTRPLRSGCKRGPWWVA
jgi:tetratricopeptide (TPR) repeat protein